MTSINDTTKDRNGMDSMISYGIYKEHTKSSPIKAVTKKTVKHAVPNNNAPVNAPCSSCDLKFYDILCKT